MSTDKANLVKVIITTLVDVIVSIISLFRDEKKDDKEDKGGDLPSSDSNS